jgi:antitoxin (DNA-binding transcriptional repressor) of toxin-antitoxin stability system
MRRPNRCITAESQGAVVIEPKTMSEIGIVASAGEGAIISPASPPITKIIGIWLPRMACAMTSTATLRFARRSSPVSGTWERLASVMEGALQEGAGRVQT